ncbi:RNB domain-containing ribonuclease [Streptomyces sp. NPDC004134]|uniref:RNB domain-containing ribonuclease n=1 Tax=Streptomyces sp. NPDC004134 TaxID=3364691 RepID=UPI0036A836EE
MPQRILHTADAEDAPLRAALRRLRTEEDVPAAFPPEVLAEADRAAKAPRLPERDATDIPFYTVDPPGSRDLDQALHVARRGGGGFRIHYAIADVAAFVTPGGALDAEAHRRVTTLYFPDARVPLHPGQLSEGAASLLPDQTTPALLWEIDLDSSGQVAEATVARALVRSRARLDYGGVQQTIDEGTAEEPVALLRDVGLLREEVERERGGISLGVPEQEVVRRAGRYTLEYSAPLPAHGWNAQVSLLTGMAAADLMLASGTGILRTLPPARRGALTYLHRIARALDIDWPEGLDYPELLRSLNPQMANHAAFLQDCTALLRGAGYTVFDGEPPARQDAVHAAVADEYAHCTAPLRRLADRYALELCVAAAAGEPPPEWVREALGGLPELMVRGAQRAGRLERECVDLVEAALMSGRIGEVFDGYVVEVDERRPTRGTVQLYEPAVIGRVDAEGPEGAPVPSAAGEAAAAAERAAPAAGEAPAVGAPSADSAEPPEPAEPPESAEPPDSADAAGPPVRAWPAPGEPLPLGHRVRVRLTAAEPGVSPVRFAPAP